MKSSSSRSKVIQNVTLFGSFINIILCIGKIIAGIVGKSSAMVADGIHSLSDLITDIIILSVSGISNKDRDHNHQYGHGKFETFATMLISFILFLVGAGICWSGISIVFQVYKGETIEEPGMIALWAAIASILLKEGLFHLTKYFGNKISSPAVIANAWHHRSDAFSSIATVLGISGAIFLGEDWRILDPITGIVVSFFIFRVAWEIAHPSVAELLETALPLEIQEDIISIIISTEGVKDFYQFKSRKIGENLAIDVIILVDGNQSLRSAHAIASNIEESIYEKYKSTTHIGIHVEPFPDSAQGSKSSLV